VAEKYSYNCDQSKIVSQSAWDAKKVIDLVGSVDPT